MRIKELLLLFWNYVLERKVNMLKNAAVILQWIGIAGAASALFDSSTDISKISWAMLFCLVALLVTTEKDKK